MAYAEILVAQSIKNANQVIAAQQQVSQAVQANKEVTQQAQTVTPAPKK